MQISVSRIWNEHKQGPRDRGINRLKQKCNHSEAFCLDQQSGHREPDHTITKCSRVVIASWQSGTEGIEQAAAGVSGQTAEIEAQLTRCSQQLAAENEDEESQKNVQLGAQPKVEVTQH